MRPREGHSGRSLCGHSRTGRPHVVADKAMGGGGAEACHYGRGHVPAVEDVASVEVAAQTAASNIAVESEEGGGPWDNQKGHYLCRPGFAGWPWEMSHLTDKATGWPCCYCCERRCGVFASTYREASVPQSRGPGAASLLQMQQAQL